MTGSENINFPLLVPKLKKKKHNQNGLPRHLNLSVNDVSLGGGGVKNRDDGRHDLKVGLSLRHVNYYKLPCTACMSCS